jgi:membrane protease YdiL (CAAX protease family)
MNNENILESKKTNSRALTALILGITSILYVFTYVFGIYLGRALGDAFIWNIFTYGVGIILGVFGIIFGFIGLNEIFWSNQKGRNVAITGIICSIIGILLMILLLYLNYWADVYESNV